MVIYVEQGANDLHMIQLTPSSLGLINVQNGLFFWCQLTQVILEKKPLNRCLSFAGHLPTRMHMLELILFTESVL